MIHVCSLARLDETVERTGARHIVSLLNAGTPMRLPAGFDSAGHLFLAMNDIIAPTPGMTPPGVHHVETYLEYIADWNRTGPLVVHCFAGISRSTAAAYIAAATLEPNRDEEELAQTLRKLAPSATPNLRLVTIADDILGRGGRMVRAIEAIGRGEDAFEGTPFELVLKAG
ncbi:putative protein tyrosine phosphatase [Hartmannibacter diazotrophicus]|uniref:Tyrosine specific protein phosphatases domain-containing protein n=1 Tax=Hartmannibacter diazotrophicus TaxID=1482074 RepID=A0A2C9D380_9HYPH|nr:protein-tyrosine phosphatase family protein [Hartmannibacter diazotrophicus]SON54720.1 putative protein tyrosine phosphatase [Hartmannibacter diazotrophicus]